MIRRLLAATALLALAACAGSYDYVTDAPAAAPAPPPPPAAEAPNYVPPPPVESAPLQNPQPAPSAASGATIAAPNVAAPPAPRPPPPPSNDIVVPGTVERQILPPTGDPRSATERARDIRAWDDCVMHAQNLGEDDPMSAQLEQPEEVCRQQLGMASRSAVPDSRRP